MSEKISVVPEATDLALTDLFALAKDTGVGPTGFESQHVTVATLIDQLVSNDTFVTNLTENPDFVDNVVEGVTSNITTTDVAQGDNLYFTPAVVRTIVEEEVGATYTLTLDDAAHKWKSIDSTNDCTLTIPPQSEVAWPDNTYIEVYQADTGEVEFAEGAGVTIRCNPNLLRITNGQYAVVAVKRLAEDEWVVFGNLEPV